MKQTILHYFQTRISRVHTSLYALQGDTDSLFEYMRILFSEELNPTIIPSDILKGILHKIEEEIKLMLDSSCVKILKPIFGPIMDQSN